MLAAGPLPVVGVWGATAHHAQLAEASGFGFFGLSGSDMSTQILGLPDAGFLTLTEVADNTRRICQAVNIPVVVDCDTGFGNAIIVQRTVREIIGAGAACLFIEDQVSPKRCGFVKGKEIVSVDEAVGKFRSACDARDRLDRDFVLMARTDARGAVRGGLEEAIRRGRAYLETGVDILYVSALQSRKEVDAVRRAFPDSLLELMPLALDPPITTREIQEWRLCTTGLHVSRLGAIMMYEFLQEYRLRGEDAYNEFSDRHRGHPLGGLGLLDLTGLPGLLELERRYLPPEHMERYEQSTGAYDPRARRSAGG
jgi:2-methylisocitrate lyase-like PEP mutase family enzyme